MTVKYRDVSIKSGDLVDCPFGECLLCNGQKVVYAWKSLDWTITYTGAGGAFVTNPHLLGYIICKWCNWRPAVKDLTACFSCSRLRQTRAKCPACDGPTYTGRCNDCDPRRPSRERLQGEVLIVLVHPIVGEREVYRSLGRLIPGNTDASRISGKSPSIMILDVTWETWVRAKEIS